MVQTTDQLIQRFVLILIGVILVPVISSLTVDANVSGTVRTVLLIVPVVFVLVILLSTIRGVGKA